MISVAVEYFDDIDLGERVKVVLTEPRNMDDGRRTWPGKYLGIKCFNLPEHPKCPHVGIERGDTEDWFRLAHIRRIMVMRDA